MFLKLYKKELFLFVLFVTTNSAHACFEDFLQRVQGQSSMGWSGFVNKDQMVPFVGRRTALRKKRDQASQLQVAAYDQLTELVLLGLEETPAALEQWARFAGENWDGGRGSMGEEQMQRAIREIQFNMKSQSVELFAGHNWKYMLNVFYKYHLVNSLDADSDEDEIRAVRSRQLQDRILKARQDLNQSVITSYIRDLIN